VAVALQRASAEFVVPRSMPTMYLPANESLLGKPIFTEQMWMSR
jgi:hypothetical protein